MFFPIDCSVSSSFFFFSGIGFGALWLRAPLDGMCRIPTGGPSQSLPFDTRLGSPSLEFLPSRCPKALLRSDPCVFFMFCMFYFFFLSDPLPLNPVVSAFDSPHLFFFCVFHWRAAVSRVAISSSECSADVCLLPMRKKKRCLNIPAPGLHMAYEFISFSIAAHQHSC